MRSSSPVSMGNHAGRRVWPGGWCLPACLAVTLLWGCAGPAVDRGTVDALPPLRLDNATLSVADAAERMPRADLLALDQSMRQFVARYAGKQQTARLRLISLHQALQGAGSLDLQYDPFADGSAREVFHRGSANCLSYASLFVALAREAGLDAHYQWQEVRPQWSRVGERVQLGLHVNVSVQLRDGKRYMVDIDPLPARDITGSRELSDSEAEALHYNNIAMDALANDDPEHAWLYLVNALELSPGLAHLWVNLGAIYRYSGQHPEAEQSYLRALALDFTEFSAMSNLAVLYNLDGREPERDFWLERAERHRQANPYYHAGRGDKAAEDGDWEVALAHYNRALGLAPRDGHLLYGRGIIYYQLNDYDAAAADISRAIELATLRSDIEIYRLQLDQVRRAALAGV